MFRCGILVGYLSFLLHVTINGLSIPLDKGAEKENIRVTFRAYDEDRVRRDADGVTDIPTVLPETTVAQLTINGTSVDINLERNNNFDDIPLFMSINGHVEQVFLAKEQTTGVYQSREHGGSFLISLNHDNNTATRQNIFGAFQHNSSLYIVQPIEGAAISSNADHVLSKVPEQTLVFEPAYPPVTGGQLPYNASYARTYGQYENKRTRRQTKTTYSVEIFTVVDYKNYQEWYDFATGTDRRSQALQMIEQYVAIIVNAVDVRYKTITSENFVFEILLAGVYIADTAQTAPWSEQRQANGTLDADAALYAFTQWINDQKYKLPQFDHAMGFTGYDLTSPGYGGAPAGSAYLAQVCESYGTSFNENKFIFPAITTVAHELGHSLGANHDGQGNACSGNNYYIMAAVVKYTGSAVNNLRKFSTCSVQYFKTYIDQLNSNNRNCMLSTRTSSASQKATTPRPLAEVYGPDETCEKVLGQGSHVCRHMQNYGNLCTCMYCRRPGSTCYCVIPVEGTPCGKGKWCENGICVISPSAPQNVTDDCPLGDKPGLYENTGMTCAQLIALDAGYCYTRYSYAHCCASCNQVKTNDATCLYGDYNATYCPTIERVGCYYNEQFCCKTCSERKNWNITGCAYGDLVTGCQSRYCDYYDVTSLASCCETCSDPAKTVQTSTSTTTTTKPTTTTTATYTTSPTTKPTTSTTTTKTISTTPFTIKSKTSISTTPKPTATTTATSTTPSTTKSTTSISTTPKSTATTKAASTTPSTTKSTTSISTTPKLTTTTTATSPTFNN